MCLGVRLNDPRQIKKAMGLADAFALAAKTDRVLVYPRRGLIHYQLQLQEIFWQFYTRDDVSGLAVGLKERRQPVNFSFDDAPHAIFAGTSGAGKTEALKSTLVALATTYTPDKLKLILVDTDSEFDIFNNIAHLTLPVATTIPQAVRSLHYAHTEFLKRKEQHIKDKEPWAVVIDEVSDLTGDKENVTMLKVIAKQGRKYGIHLILGTQRPSQKELPGVLDNVRNRFVGAVDSAQSSAFLTGQSGLDAHKLTGKGDFLHVVNGQAERFQVAFAREKDIAEVPRVAPAPGPVIPLRTITNTLEPNKQPGRPQNKVRPEILAAYIHYGVNNISINAARKKFGISRRMHELHKAFALTFLDEFKRLKAIR